MLVLALAGILAFEDRVVFGVKSGVPLTGVLAEESYGSRPSLGSRFTSIQLSHFSTGPFVDVLVWRPFGIRIEAAANYRRIDLRAIGGSSPIEFYDERAQSRIWEFPLLLKRRISLRRVTFYGAGGAVLRRAGPFDWKGTRTIRMPGFPVTASDHQDPADLLRVGLSGAAGIRVPLRGPLYLEPEIRYTHWTSQHLMPTTEQVDFVLGLSFGK